MDGVLCDLSSVNLEIEKIGRPICNNFVDGCCERDAYCPLRHLKVSKSLVCKYWLRGLCRKGDDCEAIHEYDQIRMPQCYYYAKFSNHIE
ncbi:hypothetical protein MXB_208 [Myxobolus squamalis]|nr:hypothetical protein MXB_208 [Myxobolus squamalis]